jgi:hypothetical protein
MRLFSFSQVSDVGETRSLVLDTVKVILDLHEPQTRPTFSAESREQMLFMSTE